MQQKRGYEPTRSTTHTSSYRAVQCAFDRSLEPSAFEIICRLAIYCCPCGRLLLHPTGHSINTMTAPEPGLKETILLVDDEQSVRAIVLKILRRAHYNVLEAENGETALRIAEAHPGKIDLVITDMYMPGLRGREVVERLAPLRPGLRALFISGYADQDARTGVPNGANFLNKPFSGQELASAVVKVLNGPAIS